MKISKRVDGRYGAQIRTPDGKYKTVYGKTSSECRHKAYDLIAEIESGQYVKADRTLFISWAEDWVDGYLIRIKEGTKRSYRGHLRNYIIPAIGEIKIQAIEKRDIQKLFTRLHESSKLSPKTIKNIHGTLHKCLDDAISAGLIKINPSSSIVLPKVSKPKIYPLSEEDIPKFKDAIQDSRYCCVYLFLLLTGLRVCEATGLTYDRIDLNRKTMSIDRQLMKTNPIEFSTPKHDKSRTVPLPQVALDILKLQKVKQSEFKLLIGDPYYNRYNFVFTEDDGSPCRSETLSKHLKRIMRRSNFPDLRLHDLRHTYAVLSIQAGVHIKTVQENLGHHSASFTLDQYAFVTPSMLNDAAERINNKYMSISMSK